MSLKSIVGYKEPWKKILAIDPASHSLAWAVIDCDKNIVETGKIDLSKTKEVTEKFNEITKGIKKIVDSHKIDHAIIEQSVYIQNFQSSRIISYIIGFTWGILSVYGVTTEDVSPLMWKPGIGYKNVTKKDQYELEKNGQKGSIQIKMKNERKQRVRSIVLAAFGDNIDGIEDDDIVDAIGIGLWYHLTHGK